MNTRFDRKDARVRQASPGPTPFLEFVQDQTQKLSTSPFPSPVSVLVPVSVLQEVWLTLTLTRRLPNLKLDPGRGTLDAWVATVARHHCRRVARRRSWRHGEPLDASLVELLLDPEDGPLAHLEREQQRERVQAAVASVCESMSARNRRVTVRYWVEGHSVADIAAELDLSTDCVGSVLRRAQVRLVELLRHAGV